MIIATLLALASPDANQSAQFLRCLIEPSRQSKPELEAEGLGIYLPTGIIEGPAPQIEMDDPHSFFTDKSALKIAKRSNGEIAFANMNAHPGEILALTPTSSGYRAAYDNDASRPRLGTCASFQGARAGSFREFLRAHPEKLDLMK